MDSLFRGPIHSNFAMIVNGLVSMRAYERLSYFRKLTIAAVEKSVNVTFSKMSINRWMGNSLDFLCMTFTLCVSIFAVITKDWYVPVAVLAFTL